MGLEFLYLRGQGLERLYPLRLRSPRPLIPLSLSPSNTQLVFSTLRSAAHGCDAVTSLSAG